MTKQINFTEVNPISKKQHDKINSKILNVWMSVHNPPVVNSELTYKQYIKVLG